MNPRSQPVRLLTPAQAGEVMALTTRQVLEQARQGRIAYVQVSPRIKRFHPDAIEAWVGAQTVRQGTRRAA